MTSDLRKDIKAARTSGFTPGENIYWRGPDLMVEILPGNFVNEAIAKRYGVIPKREDVEHARATA